MNARQAIDTLVEAEDPKAFLKSVPPRPENWATWLGWGNDYEHLIALPNERAWVEMFFSLEKDALQMRVHFVGVGETDEPYPIFWRFDGNPLVLANELFRAVREVERGVQERRLKDGFEIESAFRAAVKARMGEPKCVDPQ